MASWTYIQDEVNKLPNKHCLAERNRRKIRVNSGDKILTSRRPELEKLQGAVLSPHLYFTADISKSNISLDRTIMALYADDITIINYIPPNNISPRTWEAKYDNRGKLSFEKHCQEAMRKTIAEISGLYTFERKSGTELCHEIILIRSFFLTYDKTSPSASRKHQLQICSWLLYVRHSVFFWGMGRYDDKSRSSS